MKNDRIRQFRLTSGAEVLCEVLQWDDENTSEVVVRHIYRLINMIIYRKALESIL